MTDFAFPPAAIPSLPIRGRTDSFPVRRIYCVGRNYAEHAIEMGHDPDKEAPFFFQKNPDNLLVNNSRFPYPSLSNSVHHEIELTVALHKGGADIAIENAMECVYGYAVSLDMTRRDLQGEAKKAGRPWEVGKAFDHSAPCGELVLVRDIGFLEEGVVSLSVNGVERQKGDLNQLIWKVPEIISILSGLFTLAPGDLIMTGTPAGVGPVEKGDQLEGYVQGVGALSIEVV